MFWGGKNMCDLDSIDKYFGYSNSVITYTDGTAIEYKSGTEKYGEIIALLEEICEGSREMPAYGVSLNEETKKEMKNGVWLELVYLTPQAHSDMPFDSLLIWVQPHFQGFDLIRGQKGKYEGKCFHIYSPKTTMEKLYNYLISL